MERGPPVGAINEGVGLAWFNQIERLEQEPAISSRNSFSIDPLDLAYTPMSRYIRNYVPGGTYFFTVVSHQRRPILADELGRPLLGKAIRKIQLKRPFQIVAIVVLPDHLHTVWTLPPEDDNYSLRWGQIKEEFTRLYLAAGGMEGKRSVSRALHRERAVWKPRFWEHTCRDEDDLKRCVDYVHWNPVKHAVVTRVKDYPWSSFQRFVQLGEYPPGWGDTDPNPGVDDPEWE